MTNQTIEIMDENLLEELRSALLEHSSLRSIPERVWVNYSINNTYASNAIEGNSLTLEEVKAILVNDQAIPGRKVREMMETVQHQRAFLGLNARIRSLIDPNVILELHEEVFHGILSEAGRWRQVDVAITGSKHRPPHSEKVISLMERWCDDIIFSQLAGMEAISSVCKAHAAFESIHPFSDGNGRVGRLLMNLQLLKRNWPPIYILPQDREEYLVALERADEGNLCPLDGLVRRCSASSILEYLDQEGEEMDQLMSMRDLEIKLAGRAKSLAIPAAQGELPPVRIGNEYKSSERAGELYLAYR
jgi:Fic family protein